YQPSLQRGYPQAQPQQEVLRLPQQAQAQNGKTFQNHPLPDRLLSRVAIALVLAWRGLPVSIHSSRIVYNGQACVLGLLFRVIALVEPPQMLLATILKEAIDKARVFSSRFIVPDDFMLGHPEREKMIVYLKALSWKGTESGAADSARVSVWKVRNEWRRHKEFVEMEQLAHEACTDLVEETALMLGYLN